MQPHPCIHTALVSFACVVVVTQLASCRYASTFQMLRGTLVVFAGILTVILLKRRLRLHHWMGITLICAGAALVGVSRQVLCNVLC